MTRLDRVVVAFLILWPFVGWVSHDALVANLGEFGETLAVLLFVIPPCVLLLWYAFGEYKPKDKINPPSSSYNEANNE